MENIFKTPKINRVIKSTNGGYFTPQEYYLAINEDGSYTMFYGYQLQYLDGKKNIGAKSQFKKLNDIISMKDCKAQDRELYKTVYSKCSNKISNMAYKICEEKNIATSFSNIYYYTPGDEDYNKLIDNINMTLELFKKECKKNKIEYETDTKKIIKDIVEKLSKKPDAFKKEVNRKCDFCYSIESIKERFEKEMANAKNEKDFDTISYDFNKANSDLTEYTFELFGMHEMALISLKYKMPNRNSILKAYTEFLTVLPEYVKIIKYTKLCSEKANKMKQKIKQTILKADDAFVADIDKMIEHDPSTDTYLYHSTTSKRNAEKIINEGFYLYSNDILNHTFGGFNSDQILSYGYGNDYESFDNYILVIDKPNDVDIVRKLTEEERKNCDVAPRRFGLSSKPTHIVDTDYVVGYIDKENMEVIKNPNYKGYSR